MKTILKLSITKILCVILCFIYIACSLTPQKRVFFSDNRDAISMIEQIIGYYYVRAYMCPKDVQEVINLAQYSYNNSGADTFLYSGALKFLKNNIGCLSIEKYVERDNTDDTLICLITTTPIKDTLSTIYFSKDYLMNYYFQFGEREYRSSFTDNSGRMFWCSDLSKKVYDDISAIEKKYRELLLSKLQSIHNWEKYFYFRGRIVILEWRKNSLKNLRRDFNERFNGKDVGGPIDIDYEKSHFYGEVYRYLEKVAEDYNFCRITTLLYTYDLVSD